MQFYQEKRNTSRQHDKKIRQLKKEHGIVRKYPSTWRRFIFLVISGIITFGLLWILNVIEFDFDNLWHFVKITEDDISDRSFIRLSTLLATAPVLLFVWAFRDSTRLLEVANERKDTNLKEFQQLQEWATGNTDSDKKNEALQISALHSLRGYLKGQYGEDFRRGAFEIFVSVLEDVHTEVLKAVKENKTSIREEIKKNKLCKQINRIAEEEWFNLLIAHDFPTATISLVGVDLSGKYLQKYYRQMNLSQSNLQGAYLSKAQLQGANLQGAQLQGADLFGAELQDTNLSGAQLQGADLQGAELQSTNLVGAQLQGVNLSGAQLQGAYLSKAQLQGANLRGAELQSANLVETQLQGADLQGAELQCVNLHRAQLQGADLQGAKFQGTYCNDNFNLLPRREHLQRQVNKETEVEELKKAYTTLTDEDKKQLISELEELGVCKDKVRERIMNAPDELDLSEAITGKYTKEQAEEWIELLNL